MKQETAKRKQIEEERRKKILQQNAKNAMKEAKSIGKPAPQQAGGKGAAKKGPQQAAGKGAAKKGPQQATGNGGGNNKNKKVLVGEPIHWPKPSWYNFFG